MFTCLPPLINTRGMTLAGAAEVTLNEAAAERSNRNSPCVRHRVDITAVNSGAHSRMCSLFITDNSFPAGMEGLLTFDVILWKEKQQKEEKSEL